MYLLKHGYHGRITGTGKRETVNHTRAGRSKKEKRTGRQKKNKRLTKRKLFFLSQKNTRMLISIVSRVLDDNLASQKMVLILSYIVI